MNIIETKIFNTGIDQSFDYPIFFPSDGFYAIRITASAKAWWQHIIFRRSFLKKDSLTVQLDHETIIPAAQKKRLRADDFWNGNLLKGHEMTAFINVSLKQGDHIFSFISQGKPLLKELSIFQITNNTISLERLIPSDRDRVLWLTFLFHQTVTVSSFSITARAEKRKGDDDDLQITIDGIAEKNTAKRAHRDWFWCGKILKGGVKTFTRTFLRDTTPKQINMIADGAPLIGTLTFVIADSDHESKNGGTVLWKKLTLREKPTTNARIIKTLTQDSRFDVLERAVKGEQPKNEQGVLLASDRWHKIRTDGVIGFVYSEGVVIDGEDAELLQSLIRERAHALGVDPCLAVAIAQTESKFFPYAVSQAGAQGLFQLLQNAVDDVNTRYGKKLEDRFSLMQNIDGGILYFLFLQNRYRVNMDWQQRSLAAWNWGIDNVPRQGLFSLKHAPPETQNFVRRVLSAYQQCQHEKRKIPQRNIVFLALLLCISLISVVGISVNSKETILFQRHAKDEIFEERILDFDNNGQIDRFSVVKVKDDVTMVGIAYSINDNAFRGLLDFDQSILQWAIGDVNENDAPDILIHFGYTGSAGFGTLVIYEWDGNSFKKIFWRSEVRSTFGFRNVDMNDNGNEIVYYYYRRKWDQEDHEAVYRWNRDADVYELLTDQ